VARRDPLPSMKTGGDRSRVRHCDNLDDAAFACTRCREDGRSDSAACLSGPVPVAHFGWAETAIYYEHVRLRVVPRPLEDGRPPERDGERDAFDYGRRQIWEMDNARITATRNPACGKYIK